MPQICDMGPMALLPLRRKARWGFFRPEKSWRPRLGLNQWTWVLKGSTLLLDHRSRFHATFTVQCSSICGNIYCTPQNHAPHNRLSVMCKIWCSDSGAAACSSILIHYTVIGWYVPDISKYHGVFVFSYCLQLYCTIEAQVTMLGELV